jgi:transposase
MTETAILTGPERRRRWREADRLRIVEETCAPGGSISEVARRHDISRSRIYAWRREG